MLTTVLASLAASWGLVMAGAPTLQMARMWRARSSAGVSRAYFAVLIPGFGLWLAYGVASANVALIVPNAAALLIHVATVTLAYRLRHRRAEDGPALSQTPALAKERRL